MRVSFTLAEWWSMLWRLGPRMPALIRRGPRHFRTVALPEYQAVVWRLQEKPLAQLSALELLQDARELLEAAMYHLAILQVDTLGASAGSEGLFTAVYDRFARGQGDPPAPALLMGYDTVPIRSEKSLFDLAQRARVDPALTEFLLTAPTAGIRAALATDQAPPGVAAASWSSWAAAFAAHLREFGHMLYDLDFSNPVPADDPTPLLVTLKMYLRGEGTDPHERQRRLAEQRERQTEKLLASAGGIRGWMLRKTLGWAQALSRVREDSIASIGLGYPRLRALLLELGHRLTRAGALERPEQVFWLTDVELESLLAALDAGGAPGAMSAETARRQTASQTLARLLPPTTLPPSRTYLGIPLEAFIPGESGLEGDRIKGVGASAGLVTGVACVLHGPEDFEQMRPGAVLVARMTTPAWTPLFAMAAAVVTDIGGPLSHGSIVAREYGIPAVLGTGMATRLIKTGQRLSVDGQAGWVQLLPER
jgi:pyruvate,water dikinase